MPSLCDINVLLAVCYQDHAHHSVALRWLEQVRDNASIAICRVTELGLLRLLNTPAVMLGKPRTVAEAWLVYDTLMTDERFIFVQESRGISELMKEQMPGQLVSPKLWQDAYLAAFAIAAGLSLVTFDTAFRQFRDLNLVLLA